MTSPAGAILLSTSTMLLAIAASTLLLRDRAYVPGPPSPPSALSAPSSLAPYAARSMSLMSLRGFDEPPLLIRPALRCDARPKSMPLTPPAPVSQAPAAD